MLEVLKDQHFSFEPYLHYPVHHITLFNGNLRIPLFDRVVVDSSILVIPVNNGPNLHGHWVLFIVDATRNSLKVWKFDPFGQRGRKPLDRLFQQRYPHSELIILNLRVQYDGFQCGVWCVAFLRKFLGFLNSQQTTAFTFDPDFFMNTEAKSEQVLNSQRIWDLRRTLSLLS